MINTEVTLGLDNMNSFVQKIFGSMRDVSPGSLSLSVAFLFSMIFVGLSWLFTLAWIPKEWYFFVLAGFLVFIVVYGIVIKVIRTYFFHRIRPIYRIIRKAKNVDKDLKKELLERNPLDTITQEVDYWMKNKNSEIDQLKANEKFRKEFLGNVSHELKTPIFNIQGYLLSLLEGGLEDLEVNRSFLKKAENNTNRMIQVVSDLEYIAKVESGEMLLELENFDLIKLVDEVFEFHEMRARGKNIKLKYVRKPDRAILVNADRKRITDVLSNLVVNGINYGKQGGYVMLDFLDMDKQVLVEVSDNGQGIDEEHRSRIFERFYRIDKSRSRDQGGTGLGLAIVKHLVEAHGHSVNIRSTPGIGTSFSFTLDKSL